MLFDEDYQWYLLAKTTDRSWMESVGNLLRPEFFDPELEPVAKVVLDKWKQGKVLGKVQIKQLFSRAGLKYRAPSKDGDESFDQEEVSLFIRQRVTENALSRAIGLTAEGKLEKALEVVSNSRNLWPGAVSRMTDVVSSTKKVQPRKGIISTGLDRVDSLMSGGPGAGDLAVVLALPSGGKTSWLVWVSHQAVRQGHDVLYVTLEVSADEIEAKFRSSCTGMESPSVPQWRKAASKLKGSFYVVECPPGAATVLDIATFAEPEIGLIVIDYADYLQEAKADSTYEELGRVYTGLKQIAMERGIPIWNGSQANRSTYGQPGAVDTLTNLNNIEASFKKGMIASQIISFSQLGDDSIPDPRTREQIVRVLNCKNRHGPRTKDPELVSVNWATCTFTDATTEL